MAGSQNILLEGGGVGALKGNSSVKVSPAMKLPLEDITKAQACFKRKNDSRKTDHKVFAENAVRKARPFSLRNVSQTSDYGPYSGNPQTTPPVTGIKMGDWCFNQSPGHQWLFPVMSPEGLIYKPYLRRPGPMYSSTMNPAYGFPSCHYKGVGYPYLPPYVMGITNPALSGSAVEQMNWFTGPHSNVQTNQLSGVTDADDMNHQNSYSIQTSKNGALSKESELQVQATSIVEGVEPLDSDQPTRVIRIVPHNRRSATKSATRIFHSIQEERKLHDSI